MPDSELVPSAPATTVSRPIYEHPWAVRFSHWANAVTVTILTMSGLQIFAAFPSFGPKIPQKNLIDGVPAAISLGGWLGGALQWHFTFMWIFAAGGLLYVVSQIVIRPLPHGALHASRRARRLADGAPLLLLRTQAGRDGAVQPASEAGVYEHDWFRCPFAAHRPRHVQAGAVVGAGRTVRRLPQRPY